MGVIRAMIRYNKLIRDNYPQIAAKRGQQIVYHEAHTDEEYWMKLKEKLQEEMNEFEKDGTMRSLADVLDVIEAMCVFKHIDLKELDVVRENRRIDLGKFERRLVLEESEKEVGRTQAQGI